MELADLRQRVENRLYGSRLAVAQWQHRGEQLDSAETNIPDERFDVADPPADAPSAFTQLAHRVESGNLTWEDVWSGAV
ncbi:hypothetical protein, partial [Mangrovihabitans endophyticus]|uniref:hypothetical protein n=1 Tax=Mangrovihabitans endophyticus TaxID=1751298 RepID=UPI00166F31DB